MNPRTYLKKSGGPEDLFHVPMHAHLSEDRQVDVNKPSLYINSEDFISNTFHVKTTVRRKR